MEINKSIKSLSYLEQCEKLMEYHNYLVSEGKRALPYRQTKESERNGYITTTDISKMINLSKRQTIERFKVARDISLETRNMIRETFIAERMSWLSKICRLDKMEQIGVVERLLNGEIEEAPLSAFEDFKGKVEHLSHETFRKYRDTIDPYGLSEKSGYHLDHIVSIRDGFDAGIYEPKVLAHLANLRIVSGLVNLSKGRKSSMTLDKLLELYKEHQAKTMDSYNHEHS